MFDHGHHQTVRRVDGKTDVVVVLLDDFQRVVVDAGVELVHCLQCRDQRLDQQRDE